MFDSRIKEDCEISSLFITLVNDKSEKWAKIKNRLAGKTVSLSYSDRYLVTPLGCMLLAHLIAAIKEQIGVNIQNIHISVTRLYNRQFDSSRTDVDRDYENNLNRNNFLEESILSLVGLRPIIIDNGYIEHERCLTIESDYEELCIRPDAGIANGWKPFGRSYEGCSDDDFRNDWDMEMNLYNQKKNYKGILYTISYNKF